VQRGAVRGQRAEDGGVRGVGGRGERVGGGACVAVRWWLRVGGWGRGGRRQEGGGQRAVQQVCQRDEGLRWRRVEQKQCCEVLHLGRVSEMRRVYRYQNRTHVTARDVADV